MRSSAQENKGSAVQIEVEVDASDLAAKPVVSGECSACVACI